MIGVSFLWGVPLDSCLRRLRDVGHFIIEDTLYLCLWYLCGRIEYTDAFGRSRKCLKKDLPKLEENDKQLATKRER